MPRAQAVDWVRAVLKALLASQGRAACKVQAVLKVQQEYQAPVGPKGLLVYKERLGQQALPEHLGHLGHPALRTVIVSLSRAPGFEKNGDVDENFEVGCFYQTGASTSTSGKVLTNYQKTYTSGANLNCSVVCNNQNFNYYGLVNTGTSTNVDGYCGDTLNFVTVLNLGSGAAPDNNCVLCESWVLLCFLTLFYLLTNHKTYLRDLLPIHAQASITAPQKDF